MSAALDRIDRKQKEDEALALAIGKWIMEIHRESPGKRVCTGWVIDGREVLIGTLGWRMHS